MKKLGLIVLTSFFLQTSAFATTFYVDTHHASANDSNQGTELSPWKSIQKAANTLVAGDTVFIKQGIYGGGIVFPKNSGTASAWITYSAFPGHEHKAILDGYGFQIKQKSYIKVSGLRVQNTLADASGHWGIYVEGPGANFITISNNYTYNTRASGIAAFGVGWPGDPSANSNNWKNITNLIIENNKVECGNNAGYNENITIYGGVDTVEVRNNKIFNSCDVSLGGEGIDFKEGASNGKIYGNELWNLKRLGIYIEAAGGRPYYGWSYAGTLPVLKNIEVFNNYIHDLPAEPNGGNGIAIVSEGLGSIDGLKIYNNVIHDVARGGIDLYTHPGEKPEAKFNNISIINNTAYNTSREAGHGGPGIGANKPNATNVVVRNNISYKNDINLNLSGNIVQSNNLTTDPQFVNEAGKDFHIKSTSPAIDTGSSVGAPATDYDGVSRPQGSAFDIGAYEFCSGSCSGGVHTPLSLTADKVSTPPVINGRLSERGWNLQTSIAKSVIGAANNTATFDVLWDNTYLYVGVKVRDSILHQDSVNVWEDESVEIYIDANHSHSTTYDATDLNFIQGFNDPVLFERNNRMSGVLHASAPRARGYTMEMAIPWALLGVIPNGNMTIGFDVAVNDDDNGGGRDSQMMWNTPTPTAFQNTSAFGHAVLITPTGR